MLDVLERETNTKYEEHIYGYRVIADHIKAAVFLIADGVAPSNKDQGYFVRRLIRRAKVYANKLRPDFAIGALVPAIVAVYKSQYPELEARQQEIDFQMTEEESRFSITFERGLKEFEKGTDAFTLFSTYGFPIELVRELTAEQGRSIDEDAFRREMEKHQELSRAGAERKFKGGLADTREETMKLHTAHHLLLAALQKVLGREVKQRGSNITAERLRIDFSYPRKVSPEELQKVEKMVNDKIQEGLTMVRREMRREEALKLGAEMEFGARYGDVVSIYFAEDRDGNAFSKEFCGGPHVGNTTELGHFKIVREEAVASGIRRIKAVLQ
jgi:alanyl-tRNA synthetase